jgi:hypothetical protein
VNGWLGIGLIFLAMFITIFIVAWFEPKEPYEPE